MLCYIVTILSFQEQQQIEMAFYLRNTFILLCLRIKLIVFLYAVIFISKVLYYNLGKYKNIYTPDLRITHGRGQIRTCKGSCCDPRERRYKMTLVMVVVIIEITVITTAKTDIQVNR